MQYAAEYRRHFVGGVFFNFDTMTAIPLTNEMYSQLESRARRCHAV